jgi:hypothetical protein
MNTDPWALIHRYNRLVNDGLARPFTCPDHGVELVFMLGDNDKIIMWCIDEDHNFTPGTAFFADVKAVVSEYYLE